jgi:lipoate-protein ligase A
MDSDEPGLSRFDARLSSPEASRSTLAPRSTSDSRDLSLWIDATPRPGWENMAIDHALFELAEELGWYWWRLYRWQPFCLSFGRHEPTDRRYDRSRIRALGLDCVRRPTGGRAVWHARELTYSVAAPTAYFGNLAAAYRAIHHHLARAVTGLGAPAELATNRPAPSIGTGACFAVAVGGEVVVGGKKVIGSAQRRGPTALLQHGSMLLEDDQSLVRSLQAEAPIESAARRSAAPTISTGPREAPLSAVLGRRVDFLEAAGAITVALRAAGCVVTEADPPNEVLGRARRHYDSYRSDAWTWER